MAQELTESFLLELYKGCITSKSFLEIIVKHLKYNYIPEESYKKIFERIKQDYELVGSLPTIGSLTQAFNNDNDVLKILVNIKNTSVVDQKDVLISTFEKFIVNAKFIDLYSRIGELYNDGKQDRAIQLLEKESSVIANFSIKDNYFAKVFSGFSDRQSDRKLREKEVSTKVPFGIHALDFYTRGGMDKGTSHLFLGRSGTGKSTNLRWIGICAARMGMRVIHFQGEGSERECLDAYDAGWTSVNLEDIEFGHVSSDKIKKILKASQDIMASGGEIFVKASESFDELFIDDSRDIIEEIEKVNGKVDLVLYDYLEVFNVKGKFFNSESGERKRRETIANKMTNIATSFNVAVASATQANDIRPEKYNDEDYAMTRSDISEFKGALKPFSSLITINQTDDEYEAGIVRLHIDKLRKYRKPNNPIRIYQAMNISRFYDSKRSLESFWDETKGKNK